MWLYCLRSWNHLKSGREFPPRFHQRFWYPFGCTPRSQPGGAASHGTSSKGSRGRWLAPAVASSCLDLNGITWSWVGLGLADPSLPFSMTSCCWDLPVFELQLALEPTGWSLGLGRKSHEVYAREGEKIAKGNENTRCRLSITTKHPPGLGVPNSFVLAFPQRNNKKQNKWNSISMEFQGSPAGPPRPRLAQAHLRQPQEPQCQFCREALAPHEDRGPRDGCDGFGSAQRPEIPPWGLRWFGGTGAWLYGLHTCLQLRALAVSIKEN